MGCRQPGFIQRIVLPTGGSAFFIVRRFKGITLEDGAGHGQQGWAALREKFKESSREAIRAEHFKINDTQIGSNGDPHENFYIMDSGRHRLNACGPQEGPTDRHYEDILLKTLPPKYRVIRQAHPERGDFGLAGIWRMMAAIYADNQARSRSDSFRGIARRGAAMMKAMTRDCNDIKCHFCGCVGHPKSSAPYASSSSRIMMDSSRSSVKDIKSTHADSTNETTEAGEVPSGAHTTKQLLIATPNAASGGANRLTATLTLLQPGLRG